MRSGANGYALCALCRSSGYSRSTRTLAQHLSSWEGHPIKGPYWCRCVRGLGRSGGGTSSGTSKRHLPEEGRRCDSTGCRSLPGFCTLSLSRPVARGHSPRHWYAHQRVCCRRLPLCVWGGRRGGGEFGLSEAISGFHILVGVNTLPQ